MASLSNINGLRMIQFPAGPRTRKRKTLRLGRISDKNARAVLTKVDEILSARFASQPVPPHVALWLSEIDANLHTRLAKAGLATPRGDEHTQSLGPFLDSYIKKRTDLKPRTIANLTQVRNRLCERFTPQRDLATLTRSEMKDWHRWLQLLLAPATIAMHVKKARQFFEEAIDARLLTENPVKGIKAGSMTNEERMVYVPRAWMPQILDACPDDEWRLIFVLARYQGMRIPSESNRLRWPDVNFDTSRLTIRASKTEHHRNKGVRVMPLFPETLPYLLAAHERAAVGERSVIPNHRGENLRTTGEKIVRRAGLEPWEKLFQNMRASCETDLCDEYPIKVACDWIGNSEAVAKRHYLMVNDAHFDRATGRAAKSAAPDAESKAKLGKAENQNPPENASSPRDLESSRYPQGGSNSKRFSGETRTLRGKALQKALQSRPIRRSKAGIAIEKLVRQIVASQGKRGLPLRRDAAEGLGR